MNISTNKDKVIILIDGANFHYGLREAGWEIDYRKFVEYFRGKYNILDIYYFEGIHSKKSFFDKYPDLILRDFIHHKEKKLAFFKVLKSLGIKVRSKPISSVYDFTAGKYRRKCNFDVEITIKALHNIAHYQECILCSGDGDFTKLVRHLKGHYKKVTILAVKDRISRALEKAANRTESLNDLRKILGKQNE